MEKNDLNYPKRADLIKGIDDAYLSVILTEYLGRKPSAEEVASTKMIPRKTEPLHLCRGVYDYEIYIGSTQIGTAMAAYESKSKKHVGYNFQKSL